VEDFGELGAELSGVDRVDADVWRGAAQCRFGGWFASSMLLR
jgi:hypothetical protein